MPDQITASVTLAKAGHDDGLHEQYLQLATQVPEDSKATVDAAKAAEGASEIGDTLMEALHNADDLWYTRGNGPYRLVTNHQWNY